MKILPRLLLTCLPTLLAAPVLACEPVELYAAAKAKTMRKPGSYCLRSDVSRPRTFDIHAASFKTAAGEALLTIDYGSRGGGADGRRVDLDLRGHRIGSTAPDMLGVRSFGMVRNVRVSNGSIEVTGDTSVGVSMLYAGAQGMPGGLYPSLPQFEDAPAPASGSWGDSANVVERVAIRAGGRGVVLGGDNNVIRDSTIEVDGPVAIFAYGKGTVIENNTIIVHGRGTGNYDAVIKLRDARGAIVRNNRIIHKGFGSAGTAINLLDSADVRVENNILEGIENVVRQVGKTSVLQQGTQRR
ncbi:right-handed parallel beta-helix repeat-containing protein [Pseudoduganella aquatica]|uniref:right-handed parallel beta-helix repeat-containing protein n=1 Tax=Pseudoduganella aquatica TaxID=2660641 RepID=UPI001E5D6004|nr:right-handed parallel beta-helix repeat-containing protein [Pseudoduganella aquatica]